MKALVWILCIFIALVCGFFIFNHYIYQEKQADSSMQNTKATITPITHATVVIAWGEDTFYIDPTGGADAFAGQKPADVVLVTDIHGDHLSTSTLEAVVGPQTVLIVPQAVKDLLPESLATRAQVLQNGETTTEMDISILAMPMYNLAEKENAHFHAKGRGNGYVLERNGYRVYIAGDTAGTPEMRALKDIDVAFVPMNLPYTMDIDEAADAVLVFKPKVIYPYHYRGQDGFSDVEKFKQLVEAGNSDIEVVLLNWYP